MMSMFALPRCRKVVFQMETLISEDQQCGLDFEPYLNGLYGYAVSLSRNKVDAEDLVQQTCARALGAINHPWSDSNVKTRLFAILRNIWVNQCRRPSTVLSVVDRDEFGIGSASVADHPNQYVVSEDRTWLQNAIKKLPADFHEIILLRVYENLSYQEIAEVLCCSTGTVMSRLRSARSCYENCCPNDKKSP